MWPVGRRRPTELGDYLARLSYLWEYKRKREKFPKRKGEKGEKGNFLRFISTVILPMIKKSRKSPKIYCTLDYIYIIFWTVKIKNYVDYEP
jgi:hypothetical protein